MTREHKCRCLCGKAVAITYSRVNEQHLEVPFLLFCFELLFFVWHRYLKCTCTLNILLLGKIFYIPLYSVLNEYVMCTNDLFMGKKNKVKRKKAIS